MTHARTMVRPRSVLLLVLAVAACATDRPADAAGDGRATDSAGAPVVQAPGDTMPAAPGAMPAEAAILLAANGLEHTASADPWLTFGMGQTKVLADAGGVLGQPVEQGTMGECPSGPLYQVAYAGGLQLSFQDSAFVGWFARQGSPFRTVRGLGPGTTLGQLRRAYPSTKVEETSLGYEFAANELYGTVTDTTDAGVVEVVFAGTSCIFR